MICECGHELVEADRVEHRVLCGDCREPSDMARLCVESVNGCFTSPPYAEQRKQQYGGTPADQYVEWWDAVQAGVRGVLAEDGSFFVNIKEAAEGGRKQTYVKRLILHSVDVWGWQWIEEYCWPRPALPLDPNASRRFKNGWESVLQFAQTVRFRFAPDEVRHASDGCFKYKDQKAAGKQICDGGQGQGGGVMSPVNTQEGLAYPSNVLDNMGGAKIVGHSAAFPVGLPSFFIKAFSDPGDRWLDPFLGSGTTLIACEALGRIGYGIELMPAYVAVILERCVDAGMEPEVAL